MPASAVADLAVIDPSETLASLFERQCKAHADSLAYAYLDDPRGAGIRLGYRDLHQQVHALAGWLVTLTQPGDRVLLALGPGLDFVRIFWACLVTGRVAVPVPAPEPSRLHHAAPRLRSVIADSRATLVLTGASLLDAVGTLLDPATFAMTRWVAVPEAADPALDGLAFVPPPLAAQALAYLQYTSGSTSAPRGVRLTHANVLSNMLALAQASGASAASRSLSWLPHFHDYGLVCGVLTPLAVGASSLLMSPFSFLRRPLRWLEAVAAHRITHTGAPESAFVACLTAMGDQPLDADLSSLVSLSCGAEPIRAETVERVLAAFGAAGMRPQAFVPCYGLAESVLGVTTGGHDAPPRIVSARGAALLDHRFESAGPGDGAGNDTRRLVGCGRPLFGTEVLIADPQSGTPRADGRIGEILVRSPSVGGGYWMQPAASEATFGLHLPDGRGPYLRTGDLGFIDQGELFVTGRLKDLIIVHGENHYPQDLEWSAERAHAALRRDHAVAFAVDTPGGEAVVLALELERRAGEPDLAQIAAAVRRAIAIEHALPLHAVALLRAGGLPRTSSGKLQRQLSRQAWLAGELPLLAETRFDAAADATDTTDVTEAVGANPAPDPDAGRPDRPARVMPGNALEQATWDIWSEVLGTRAFGIHESFFELGGNSLRMTQVLSRLNARFGIEMPLVDMFEYASVAALAAQVGQQVAVVSAGSVSGAAVTRPPPIERVPRGAPLPASLSQRRMWVIQHFDPASTAYNVPLAIHLRGDFDASLCQQAFDSMVARHEGLRTRFVMGDNEPMQWIEPALTVPIEQVDLRPLPASERHDAARTLLAQRLAEPFDLARAPLHRPLLLRLGEREYVVFWLLHHAITDNWAGVLLMREALQAYEMLAAGGTPNATPPAIEYGDYAAWERRADSVLARAPHMAYWRERLQGLPDLALPTDFPRPPQPSFKGARTSAELSLRLRDAMREFAVREAVSPFVIFLSAFALMLSRQAASEDVAIGTPIANRHRFAAEQLVGTLVNTLVMRTDLSGDPSFTQLVQRVRQGALEGFAHQDAPFDEVIDALGHDRTLRPQGPVRVLFNVLNAPVGPLDFKGLEIDEFDFERTAAQFDLSLHVDTEFAHRIHLEYASDLYAAVSAERMLENYLALVERLLAQPERRLSAFEMVSPGQMQLLRHVWNGTQAPQAAVRLAHAHVRLGDLSVRDRVAVIGADDREITFGELEGASNRLAHALRARGIGRGQRVGLCIPRSPDMLISQLAVMKAGAAYVPLDPAYPIDRLRFMATDAELSAVLTRQGEAVILEDLGLTLLAIEDPALTQGQPVTALAPDTRLDATPDDEAYVIYTSGSTGRPKGVQVLHRGVVNFLEGMVEMLAPGADDCFLAITSPSFDISVLDLMLPLRVRARVVIASHAQVVDPGALRGLLERHRATLLQATPSAWRMLLETGWTGGPGFRALIGGEPLPATLAERLLERTGELWNVYGPTEATVWATGWRVQAPRAGIAIGRPMLNTTVWALDPHGHVCPIGVPGELYIGGVGVARGYFRRDDLTAERFLPDPFADDPRDRFYRTGDLGRWRHDGQLEHLGRPDHQVKLRGHRIEMGEIESALLDHPDVAHCVATTHARSEEDVRLVAYLVPRDDIAPTPSVLREHLRARLPHFMIPQHFVALWEMPLLPNGKIDRSALPAPAMDVVLAEVRTHVAPATHSEHVIAGIWSQLLALDQVSCTDNFFDLGGHSLLAMRCVTLIESELGVKVTPTRLIFETLRQIAVVRNAQE